MPNPASTCELLRATDEKDLSEYYVEVLERLGEPPLEIKKEGTGNAKGVFATQDVTAGKLLFREAPLVGEQHSVNKDEALVCSHCFRFLGSIELQAAWLLRHSPGVSPEIIKKLQIGGVTLPFGSSMILPQPMECRGMCDELYCSLECADSDWIEHHCLLCTGSESNSGADARNLEALQAFRTHAEETNDIFLLAAKVVAKVLLAARQLSAASEGEDAAEADAGALRKAWAPFGAGWKAVWWESVATPSDVKDEAAFRADLKELASDSLMLLRKAVYDERFCELFSLEVFGSIVGMFELNNLDIFIQHPLHEWAEAARESLQEDAICDYTGSAALLGEVLEPLESALESVAGCEGTAFFALQSCMNHSCSPNATASRDGAGASASAELVANRQIKAGEEVTISYINEEMEVFDRQAALRDYGFRCTCQRCVSESAGALT